MNYRALQEYPAFYPYPTKKSIVIQFAVPPGGIQIDSWLLLYGQSVSYVSSEQAQAT